MAGASAPFPRRSRRPFSTSVPAPAESWAYADLHAAGLPPTDVQVVFRDGSSGVVARADIGFELDDGSWYLIEIDGREHHPLWARARDDDRDNRLVTAALTSGTRASVVRRRTSALGYRGVMVREASEVPDRAAPAG